MTQIIGSLKLLAYTTLAAVFAWLIPLKIFVTITLFLLLVDLLTGTQSARVRGEVIHSKGLRRTVVKFNAYVLAILAAHGIQTVYFNSFPMVFTISCYISVTEFWSILENVGTITGTNVLESVHQFLNKTIKKQKETDDK